MIFSSLFFLYAFLPLTLLATLFCRRTETANMVLLLASLIFYAWGEPIWIVQMLISGALIWLSGLAQERARLKGRSAKPYLLAGLAAALLPLLIFKYSGFIVENLNLLGLALPVPSLKMPIGISFYTFQVISYAIDLYRGQVRVQRSLLNFWLYESLFPQLIAGPIVRYSDVEKALTSRPRSNVLRFSGLRRFAAGLAKKVLLANPCGALVEQSLESGRLSSLSGLEALLALVAFSLQIYFDFSAYSDMAIGLGRIFSFEFMENFTYPYVARSVTEFWRRWHRSLSFFFRDYVYIPLGGNRRHQIFNLCVVWLLTGLWHGASWNFLLWGLFFLFFLLIEKLVWLRLLEKLPAFVGHLYLIPVLLASWSLFKFTRLQDLLIFWRRLLLLDADSFWSDFASRLLLQQKLPFLLLCILAALPIWPFIQELWHSFVKPSRARTLMTEALGFLGILAAYFFATASLVADSFNPFLYFRF